jgi:hypothetical protein
MQSVASIILKLFKYKKHYFFQRMMIIIIYKMEQSLIPMESTMVPYSVK